MNTTRRMFLGGVTALTAWPQHLCGEISAKRSGEKGVPPWERPDGSATDSVMVRRLYLDLAGRIPTKDEAQSYVASTDHGKRAALVEQLIDSKEFADYWAMRFCDILRVKSEFPINLWPNAVYSYHARIRAFVERNEPWDTFGRALLTAQGSDFRDAEANFFRATDRRTPEGWAEATAQTFLGIPPARLSYACRDELARYFANVKIKNTREWKEEIVYVDGDDRRGELCDWLFGAEREEVAATFRRRIHNWIFGPKYKAADTSEVDSMRLKDVLREVAISDEYARGSVTGGFPARRLDAEVLDDAFCTLSGTRRNYQSPAPEPFTFFRRRGRRLASKTARSPAGSSLSSDVPRATLVSWTSAAKTLRRSSGCTSSTQAGSTSCSGALPLRQASCQTDRRIHTIDFRSHNASMTYTGSCSHAPRRRTRSA